MFETFNYRRYGEIIVFLLSLYLLSNKYNLLVCYTIGTCFNIIINTILKGLIQQPRPNDNPELLNLALQNGKRHIYKNGIPYSIYGMPSGHSQYILYSTIFVYLSLKNPKILLLYLLIAFIINGLNVWYSYHTVFQVIVGGIVGVIIGYIFYYIAQHNLKGILKAKPDDFGPI